MHTFWQVVLFHKLLTPVHRQYLTKPDIDAGNQRQAPGWDDGLFEIVNKTAEADAILYYAIGDSNDIYSDIAAAGKADWEYTYTYNGYNDAAGPSDSRLNPGLPSKPHTDDDGHKNAMQFEQCKKERVGKRMYVKHYLI